jgi:hypothetical protein
MSPAVYKVFDNGGISQTLLAYEMVEDAEDEDEPQECGFQTTAATPGTQSLSNLVPSSKFKKKFAEEVLLGSHSAKIFQQYVDTITKNEFSFKSLADVKEGDFEKLMSTIPEPWVRDKRFSIQG